MRKIKTFNHKYIKLGLKIGTLYFEVWCTVLMVKMGNLLINWKIH